MAHLKVTNVVLSLKPTPAFSPLGDELAWQSDVSLGQLLRVGPIIVVQWQMRDSSKYRQTAVSKHWISPTFEKTLQHGVCFLRKVLNNIKQCVQGMQHTVHVSLFIGGNQPDHICAYGQGKPWKFLLKTTFSCIRSAWIWLYPPCSVGSNISR